MGTYAIPWDGNGALEWTACVHHCAVSHLSARLVPGASGAKDAVGSPRSSGKCSIEVWASSCGDEIAYCRGLVCARENLVRILWLGRSNSRAVHFSVKGYRCVPLDQSDQSGAGKDNSWTAIPKQATVAEALFGLVAVIAERLDASVMELQAMDNGSGKLVELYLGLGFWKLPQVPGEIQWMATNTAAIVRLAPSAWTDVLVPANFDGPRWLQEVTRTLHDRRLLQAKLMTPIKWKTSWPSGASASVTLLRHGHSEVPCERFMVEACLADQSGQELVYVRANTRLSNHIARIIWIGRSRSRPAHPSIRGQPAYGSCPGIREDQLSQRPGLGAINNPTQQVTAAIGMLGAVSVVSRWVGAATVGLQALDDGSGKLVRYLKSLGFSEFAESNAKNSADGNPWLEVPCKDLANRCCPAEWLAMLPQEPLKTLAAPGTVSSTSCPPKTVAAPGTVSSTSSPPKSAAAPGTVSSTSSPLKAGAAAGTVSSTSSPSRTNNACGCQASNPGSNHQTELNPPAHSRVSTSGGFPRDAGSNTKDKTPEMQLSKGSVESPVRRPQLQSLRLRISLSDSDTGECMLPRLSSVGQTSEDHRVQRPNSALHRVHSAPSLRPGAPLSRESMTNAEGNGGFMSKRGGCSPASGRFGDKQGCVQHRSADPFALLKDIVQKRNHDAGVLPWS